MKKILVLGAGLSSSYLIKYLLDGAQANNWFLTVADANVQQAEAKIKQHPQAKAIALNAGNREELMLSIEAHDLVISLLPPTMHIDAAKWCIALKKHLITASYVSDEMRSLHTEALQSDVLLLNECGLDPGIDHLSAMKLIHEIESEGGEITSFKSFCGGLVAPEFDDNPWNYKFTWNPRNVVLAGQATAKYLEQGELKFIPPSRIFTHLEPVSVKGYGEFESYANRDSLGYIQPYGIQKAHTVLRGTLRKKGYSDAWNCLIKLGLTDDTFTLSEANKLTWHELLSAFTPGNKNENLEQRVASFLQINVDGELMNKLKWLGIFDETPIEMEVGTPAQILQKRLQQKWKLNAGELDMIVMHHEIEYRKANQHKTIHSSLVVKGENETLTAMAKTVGLPMAICAKLILNNQIQARGVQIPISRMFYEPVLKELSEFGVEFSEYED